MGKLECYEGILILLQYRHDNLSGTGANVCHLGTQMSSPY